jgi:acetolactate synthase small subunit
MLGRVVSLFHRRAIEIEQLIAERSEESNVLRIKISVAANAEALCRIEANLFKIVDVLSVQTVPDGTQATQSSP